MQYIACNVNLSLQHCRRCNICNEFLSNLVMFQWHFKCFSKHHKELHAMLISKQWRQGIALQILHVNISSLIIIGKQIKSRLLQKLFPSHVQEIISFLFFGRRLLTIDYSTFWGFQ